jgi:hypothetical protein
MKRFLNKITPAFIHQVNAGLLKNNVLGWQLQLPLILWFWLLISLLTISVPFLYPLDLSGNDDEEGTIAIGILLGILQFFLYGYILIQFNATKNLGKKIFLHGIKEQLAYFIVMVLCLSQLVLYPIILDYRKSAHMTDEEIIKEALIYNNGRAYFMDSDESYLFFPNDSLFKEYINFRTPSDLDIEADTTKFNSQNDFYERGIEPLVAPFYSDDEYRLSIDPKYGGRDGNGPQLYFTGDDYLQIEYLDDFYLDSVRYCTQLTKKSDVVRLSEIKAFILLYKKYEATRSPQYDEKIEFNSPEIILQKYKSNKFEPVIEWAENMPDYKTKEPSVYNGLIDSVHSTVWESRYEKWDKMEDRAFGCFFVCLAFAILIFVFKNVRIKEFILSFVYCGLLVMVVTIMCIVTRLEEHLALHVPIIIFFTGIYFTISSKTWPGYMSLKTVFVIVSNICIAFVPIFFFFYFTEYLDFLSYSYKYCEVHPDECARQSEIKDLVRLICLWGGSIGYLFLGSLLYKWAYQKIFALPLRK